MKKSNILIMSCGLLMSAAALAQGVFPVGKAQSCGFQDNMNIVAAPSGTKIMSMSATGGLAVSKTNDGAFTIRDNGQCTDGTATITIGSDTDDYTVLTIQEGPWQWNPEVVSHHDHGKFSYIGMDHDTGSFDYELKFSN